jgi:hypothetical protein
MPGFDAADFSNRTNSKHEKIRIPCLPSLTIIFRPKIVFSDTDSILRVKTMYESVK